MDAIQRGGDGKSKDAGTKRSEFLNDLAKNKADEKRMREEDGLKKTDAKIQKMRDA